MASVIQGHRNPFGKQLFDYTTPEMDFVLEMAAKDDPEKWTFTRSGKSSSAATEALAGWGDVLKGVMALRYLEHTGIAAAQAGVQAWRRQSTGGLRLGLTRGGKALTDDADTRNQV